MRGAQIRARTTGNPPYRVALIFWWGWLRQEATTLLRQTLILRRRVLRWRVGPLSLLRFLDLGAQDIPLPNNSFWKKVKPATG